MNFNFYEIANFYFIKIINFNGIRLSMNIDKK